MNITVSGDQAKETQGGFAGQRRIRGHRWRLSAVSWLTLFCVLVLADAAVSQTIKGSYTLFDRDSTQVQHLLSLLSKEWSGGVPEEALACFFDKNGMHDATLATLLIFIDKTKRAAQKDAEIDSGKVPECLVQDQSVRSALLKNGKIRKELFGEKYVYVIVFVAEWRGEKNSVGRYIFVPDPAKEEKKVTMAAGDGVVGITRTVTEEMPQKEPVSVSLSSVDSRPGSGEFFLYSMLKAVVNIISGASLEKGEAAARAPDIKNVPLKMFLVGSCGTEDKKTNLYYGIYKIALSENTIDRITVKEEYEDESNAHQTKQTLHVATFGNYSGSWITSSIGLMWSFDLRGFCSDTAKKSIKFEGRDAFAFVHMYLKRPNLPPPRYQHRSNFRNTISWSLVAGTKISKSLFDDVFIGGSVGHFLSTVGLVAGVNFRTVTTARTPATTTSTTISNASGPTTTTINTPSHEETERKPYFCIGFTLMF